MDDRQTALNNKLLATHTGLSENAQTSGSATHAEPRPPPHPQRPHAHFAHCGSRQNGGVRPHTRVASERSTRLLRNMTDEPSSRHGPGAKMDDLIDDIDDLSGLGFFPCSRCLVA